MKRSTRSASIRIRLTEEEHAMLLAAAGRSGVCFASSGRGNLSEYLRRILLKGSGVTDYGIEKELRELNYEMRKIGVNVNQLAKKANSFGCAPEDVARMTRYLKEACIAAEKTREEVEEAWRSQSSCT